MQVYRVSASSYLYDKFMSSTTCGRRELTWPCRPRAIRSLYLIRHSRDFAYQAGPPVFQRETLKSWVGPGDEAKLTNAAS